MDDKSVPTLREAEGAASPSVTRASRPLPRTVSKALGCPSQVPAEQAWDTLLERFGDLILRTATLAQRRHHASGDLHDASMDAYTYILDRLRDDDFKRLRAFRGDGEDGFSRWLVVVSRRLCTDLWRSRYGRARGSTAESDLDIRRRLVDALWEPGQPDELPSGRGLSPEQELRRAELRGALESALADLEAGDRLLLSYRFDDGLSARRISGLMEFPTPFHVYRRVNTILKRVRRRLEYMGFDAPDP